MKLVVDANMIETRKMEKLKNTLPTIKETIKIGTIAKGNKMTSFFIS